MTPDAQTALARGRECIRIEMEALQTTADALDETFVAVVEAVEAAQKAGRKLIFSGVGSRPTSPRNSPARSTARG